MNQHLETDLLWFDETPSVPAGPTPSLRGRTPEQAPQRGLSPGVSQHRALGSEQPLPFSPWKPILSRVAAQKYGALHTI